MDLRIINSTIERLESARDNKEEAQEILLNLLHRVRNTDKDAYIAWYGITYIVDSICELLCVVLHAQGRTDQYVGAFDAIINEVQANKGRLI